MEKRLIFDIETNAVDFKSPDPIAQITVVHCLVTQDADTGEQQVYRGDDIPRGLAALDAADVIIGHNIARFDVPALKSLYDWEPTARLWDTLVASDIIYGKSLYWRDAQNKQAGKYDLGRSTGQHSLGAWGQRLGEPKDDYLARWDGDAFAAFSQWNPEMEEYCRQDVRTNAKLYKMLHKAVGDAPFVDIDTRVTRIIARQERRGFALDVPAAKRLATELSAKRESLRFELQKRFKPFYLRDGKDFTPKRDNAKQGYCAGATLTKVKLVSFNPASDDHVTLMLKRHYGWKPVEFTDKGHAQVTEAILKGMRYDIAETILSFKVLDKRLSQIAEADGSWVNLEVDGRVHGRVHVNGTRTGRMSHSDPNQSACPRVGNPYGAECRSLWVPSLGMVLVGADASGIELRMLAHYLGRYDGGAFRDLVLHGDVHQNNADLLGCSRDCAKTIIYAYLYGAGNEKLGRILLEAGVPNVRSSLGGLRAAGKRARSALEAGYAGLPALRAGLTKAVARGYAVGLDGRRLYGLSLHNALNSILQSAAGLVMKRALVILDESLQRHALTPGVDYEFVANVHDEWQIETMPEFADLVGETAVAAIEQAGDVYNIRCPLTGEYKTGASWKETH